MHGCSHHPPLLLGFRSPLLLTLSGSVGMLVGLIWSCRYTIFPAEVTKVREGSDMLIVIIPLVATGYTTVYGWRGLRLLMMYDSAMRRRWGRVPNERAIAKGLIASFLAIEAIAWSVRLVYGDR